MKRAFVSDSNCEAMLNGVRQAVEAPSTSKHSLYATVEKKFEKAKNYMTMCKNPLYFNRKL